MRDENVYVHVHALTSAEGHCMCICMTDKGDKCKCHTERGLWQAKQISISHQKLLREKIKRGSKRTYDMGKVCHIILLA